MRVLLVHLKDVAEAYMPKRPPLGIGYLGTILHNAGHSVKLLDMRVKKFDVQYFNEVLRKFKPEVVGLSIVALSFDQAKKLTKDVKTKTSAILIGGGPEATLIGVKIFDKIKELDYVITGEGEYSTLEFINKLEKEQDVSKIPGIMFKKKGKIHSVKPKTIENLDAIPFPNWELFDLKAYKKDLSKIKLPIMTSRGCPYSCKFCESSIINKGYRVRNPKNVVDEMEFYHKKFGTKNFQIMDDNFPVYTDRVLGICDEIIKRKLKFTWVVGQGFSPSKGNYELFKRMREAGCIVVYFGIESADDEILREIRKPHTVAQVRRAIKDAKKAGLIVKAPFISGLPKSTFEKELKYIKFFKETGIDMPKIGHLVPFPGTLMYEYVKNEARPLMDIDKMHEFVTAGRGSNDSDFFRPAFDTKEYPLKEREKMLALFQKESEMYILQNMFGKFLGAMAFKISRIRFIRKLGVKMLDIYYTQF